MKNIFALILIMGIIGVWLTYITYYTNEISIVVVLGVPIALLIVMVLTIVCLTRDTAKCKDCPKEIQ